MTATPLLELDRLVVTHVGRRDGRAVAIRAVDGVSLTVGHGEAVGLVGESGCGKSTLARAAVRLLEPAGGTIRYRGTDITHLRGRRLRELRGELRIVFQDPYASLNPRLTVAGNVARPLQVAGRGTRAERRARVEHLLELVGLGPELADRVPSQLSGGQRQRVGIARALAPDPSLVVLDEPVSSLDQSVRTQVLSLLARLRAELGVSFLFIGHDISAVRALSDRIAVMHLGTIVEVGPTAAVLDRPRHPYTEALRSAVPVPDPVAARRARRIVLDGELPDPADPPGGCGFRTRCWRADDDCLDRPVLRPVDGRDVACHHPADGVGDHAPGVGTTA
ncbi:MAG: ABC transporter ATP-binding protein [Actinomycetes bacterium]